MLLMVLVEEHLLYYETKKKINNYQLFGKDQEEFTEERAANLPAP
jgi:hypothetical protein